MSALVSRLLVVIIALCAAAIIGIFILADVRWRTPEARTPDLPSIEMLGFEPRAVDAEVVAAIAERPLFFQSRRPHLEPVLQQGAPEIVQEPFPSADLLGIFRSGYTSGVILSSGNETTRVPLGVAWRGWRLRSVDAERISATFTIPGRADHELKLKRGPQRGDLVTPLPASDTATGERLQHERAAVQSQGGVEPAGESSGAEGREVGEAVQSPAGVEAAVGPSGESQGAGEALRPRGRTNPYFD